MEVLNLQISKPHVVNVNLKNANLRISDSFRVSNCFLIQNISVASGWSGKLLDINFAGEQFFKRSKFKKPLI